MTWTIFLFGRFMTEASRPCLRKKTEPVQVRHSRATFVTRRANRASPPSPKNKTENTTTLWDRKPEDPNVVKLAKWEPPTIQICSHHHAVDTASTYKKMSTHPAWRQPLAHHRNRDSHENQLLLPPAEESASSHASTFRSASDKARVGIFRCAFHSSWRAASPRSTFVAQD